MADRVPGAEGVLAYVEGMTLVAEYARGLRTDGASERVPLLQALGRVLARPVLADREQPPFRRATRDGFACRAQDVGAPLRVLGLVRAGESWGGPALGAGDAVEIMTGAPLPPGADCVVMVEHVEVAEGGVRLGSGRTIAAGDNYVEAGAEARAGAVLVSAGVRLGAAQIAAAASVGQAHLEVFRRPRVGILSTGDELVDVAETPELQQIRNSNSYSLAAQVLAAGGEPLVQPVARDTEESLRGRLAAVLAAGVDLLLLSGGVSAGKYDLVEKVLMEMGARFLFTGVRIQPGKPVVLGELPRTGAGLPLLGLPGNPVSTMVTFTLFAAPLLAALGGEANYTPRFAEARLRGTLTRKPQLRRFLPALLSVDADGAQVRAVPWQGSGDVAGTAGANCFVVVPEAQPGESAELTEGSRVRVLFGVG